MDQIMHFCSNRTWLFMVSIMVVSAGVYIAYFRQTSPVLDGVRKPPHIIFILVDDLGWNDVSFHGSAQIPTPNIDALAASGIILNNYYTSPQCTPSRASLLTGKYPFNTGLQHYVINAAEPTALPLEFTIMPQYLKRLGYATHLIGKWHLGYFKKEYTPTYRGFDTFWGFWNGVLDYYDYTNHEDVDIPGVSATWGIDLHNGTHEITDFRGKYATDVFTEKAVHIISQHDISQPLFLELNHLACHHGNRYHLMQAPPARVAKFKHIKEHDRRTYAGVVSSLDESVGKVFQSLYEKGMLSNSIIVFSSDNGGAAAQGKSSNWPLRGTKMYMWEGSVRVSAVLWSPLLKLEESRVSMQMMHISDWLPTLYYVAGGNLEDLDDTDGKNMWEHLLNNTPSPRKEIPLNIDSIYGMSALINGNFKLVQGSFPGKDDFWYGPSGKENSVESLDSWVWKDGSIIKYLLEKMGNWIVKKPDGWRINARINCSLYHKPNEEQACNPRKGVCLFDLSKDPCEYLNIAFDHPEVVKNMLYRIQELNSTSMKSLSKPVDPRGDPRCHNFTYVSWLDEKHLSDCPWL